MKWLNIIVFSLMVFSVHLSADTKSEIDHLLNFVSKTTCKYERNGTMHTGREAREHIQKKYEYFREKGKIHSAEDFIRYSASKSELSGRTYKVHCPGSPTENSSDWLMRELAEYRNNIDRSRTETNGKNK